MTEEEIRQRADALNPWYHEIELFPGYVTASYMLEAIPQWNNTRSARKPIDYTNKTVLDIGTMSGMWAFEAEQKGAQQVITVDIYQNGRGLQFYNQCLLARMALGSNVVFVPNGDVHDLPRFTKSLQTAFDIKDGFDIIQFMGVLYHNEHPLLSLLQVRRCCKLGGKMLLETAVYTSTAEPVLRFNADEMIYNDSTTFWAPSVPCLYAMLKFSGWAPVMESESFCKNPLRPWVDRLAITCEAIASPNL